VTRERIYQAVRRVPSGRVVTYGQIAAIAGGPRSARAVGQAMRHCPPGVPWHRVVNGQGTISRRGDGSGMLSQRLLLEGEGVRFSRGRIDLDRYGWPAPSARRGFRPERLEPSMARAGGNVSGSCGGRGASRSRVPGASAPRRRLAG
jgi:methylated-DNA-protein-cysteine methyltransferase-like protein